MASKSFSDIVASIKSYLVAVTPNIATYTGTVIGDIINAISGEISDNYITINQTKADMFISTASGSALDAKAADYGIVRLPGNRATGTVTLSRPIGASTAVSYSIPQGTQVSTVGDSSNLPVYFVTSASATLSAGNSTVDVAIQARDRGTVGNVSADTITILPSGIAGIGSVNNAAETTDGADQETDTALRARTLAALAPLYSATAIAAAARGVAGVFDAAVSDPADGTGAFTVYACDVAGALSSDLNAAVLAAVNARKVIGTTPTISAPTVTTQAVTVTATVTAGYNSTTVKANVSTAITAFVNGLKISDDLIRFKLLSYVSDNVAGLDDLTMATPGSNTTADASHLIRVGSVTVS